MADTHGARRRRRHYLLKRGRWWYFRRRVPADLALAAGRSVVLRSLQTTSYREAKVRAASVEYALDRLFLQVRLLSEMDEDDLIQRLCTDYFDSLVEGDRELRRRFGQMPAQSRDKTADWNIEASERYSAAQDEAERLAEGDRSSVREAAEGLLAEMGQSLEGEGLDRLCFELDWTRFSGHLDREHTVLPRGGPPPSSKGSHNPLNPVSTETGPVHRRFVKHKDSGHRTRTGAVSSRESRR